MNSLSSLFILTLILGCAKADNRDNGLVLNEVEKNLIEEINKERKKHGSPPVELYTELQKSTREHCKWMAENDNLRHVKPVIVEDINLTFIEIIGAGQSTPKEIVGDWLKSRGHRNIMLNKQFKFIGAAAFKSEESGYIYWCTQFSRIKRKMR